MELRQLVEFEQASRQRVVLERVNFGADFGESLRVLSQQIECPRRRVRGGLVASAQQCHDLVADFLPSELVSSVGVHCLLHGLKHVQLGLVIFKRVLAVQNRVHHGVK